MNPDMIRRMQQRGYCIGYVEGMLPKDLPSSMGVAISFEDLIDTVIFHDPATIIKWKTGAKTVVKVQNGEPFDKEKGFTMAVLKYINGNTGSFNNIVKRWCE